MAGPLRPLYPNRVACVSGELFRDRTSRSALPAPPSSPLFVWNLANKKTFRVGFFFFSTRLNEPPNSFALKQTQRRLNIKPASQRTDKQTNKQTNKQTHTQTDVFMQVSSVTDRFFLSFALCSSARPQRWCRSWSGTSETWVGTFHGASATLPNWIFAPTFPSIKTHP